MSARIWHKGPPPHVGWFNASNRRDEDAWRWWNGDSWSYSVNSKAPQATVDYLSARPSQYVERIEWTDYWPKNARVPRIDPRKGMRFDMTPGAVRIWIITQSGDIARTGVLK